MALCINTRRRRNYRAIIIKLSKCIINSMLIDNIYLYSWKVAILPFSCNNYMMVQKVEPKKARNEKRKEKKKGKRKEKKKAVE